MWLIVGPHKCSVAGMSTDRSPGTLRLSRPTQFLIGGILAAMAAIVSAADKLPPAQAAEVMPKAAQERALDVTYGGPGLVAVGDRGHILLSEDGHQWQQANVPVRAMLNSVEFIGEQVGYAVGHDNVILKTADGGKHWSLQEREIIDSRPYFDTEFDDANNGFVVGSYGRFKQTTDGGKTWTVLENPISEFQLHLYGLTRLNNGTLLLVGERSIMARSTDNAATWEMIVSPYAGSWFGAVPWGESGAILHGLRGNVFYTADVNALQAQDPEEWDEFSVETITDPELLTEMGWQRLDTGSTSSLLGATAYGRTEVWLTGVNGPIYKISGEQPKISLIRRPNGVLTGGVLRHNDALIVTGQKGIETIKLN